MISHSRANLCEMLATRIFRANANNLLQLTMALTTSWLVYSGADPALISQAKQARDDDLEERVGNAIEMAILGKAKRFIKSSACQKVIDVIWSWVDALLFNLCDRSLVCFCRGKCVYQAQSSHAILSDVCLSYAFYIHTLNYADLQTYKRTPIHFYDPHKAPLLDHYRSVSFSVLLNNLIVLQTKSSFNPLRS